MAPLTAAELMKHPEFPHVTWNLPPTSSGRASVAEGRGGPFDIAYEIHGTGDIRLIITAIIFISPEWITYWIMGLGALKTAWQRQTRHFAHTTPDRRNKYSSLIFDNRGMGASGKPTLRYSTTEMARDIVDLISAIGWNLTTPSSQPQPTRDLHLIGVSMGGMIAQELAYLLPGRIASLNLVSTAARLENTIGFYENLRQRINLFIPKEINAQLAEIKARLFSAEFLDQPDEELGGRFPTNGDRFAAQELSKRLDKVGFTRKGFVLQAVAAGWHFMSKERLAELAERVGRGRICVMHGTIDGMITYPHAEVLRRELGEGIRFERFEGRGHVLLWEEEEAFNRIVEEMVDKGRELDGS